MALDQNGKELVLVRLFMGKSRKYQKASKMDYFRRNLKGDLLTKLMLINERIQHIRGASGIIIKTFSLLENILRVVLIKILDDEIKHQFKRVCNVPEGEEMYHWSDSRQMSY